MLSGLFWVLLIESLVLQRPRRVLLQCKSFPIKVGGVVRRDLGESQSVALPLAIHLCVLFRLFRLTKLLLHSNELRPPLTYSYSSCYPLTHRELRSGHYVRPGAMEQLQAFDDKIVNLILQYSLLDLSAPDRITADEVYAAAELALQISTRNEAGHTTQHPPSGATVPRPARNDPKRKPPARETQAPKGRQAMTTQSRVIGAEERREILLDSDSDAETESKTKGEPCIACAGGSGEKRRLPCGCNYCAPCLRRCIRSGLRNEESWPPRCHERLTEEDVRRTRRPGLLRLWRQMATEWDSPASGRLYCSRPACAAFIPRAEGQTGEVRCGACGEGTCGGCRRSWHPGLPCGEEEEEEQLMDMMDQYGYASCNNCRRIVDLREGCNHIT